MRHVKIASELMATDWVLARWAVSVGDGLFGIQWEDIPQSRVPILSDQMAIAVDQLVLRSGENTHKLVGYWYRTALPKTVIAHKLKISRDSIYLRWNAALYYFRDRFLESPLSDLRLAARTDMDGFLTPARKRPTEEVANIRVLNHDIGAECGNCLNGLLLTA